MDSKSFSDKEWDYIVHICSGQLIIHGNGATLYSNQKFNLMCVGDNANIVLDNMTIKKFNHVFINHGFILCENVSFTDNIAFKIDVSECGAVAHNYKSIYFKSCYFKDNYARIGLYYDTEGVILETEPGSMNIFDRCKVEKAETKKYDVFTGDRNSFIYARPYSTVVFYQDINVFRIL